MFGPSPAGVISVAVSGEDCGRRGRVPRRRRRRWRRRSGRRTTPTSRRPDPTSHAACSELDRGDGLRGDQQCGIVRAQVEARSERARQFVVEAFGCDTDLLAGAEPVDRIVVHLDRADQRHRQHGQARRRRRAPESDDGSRRSGADERRRRTGRRRRHGRRRLGRSSVSLTSISTAGSTVSVPSQAMATPMATKMPKTWTGGIGVSAKRTEADHGGQRGERDRPGEFVVDGSQRRAPVAESAVPVEELADHVDRVEDRDRHQEDRDHRTHDVEGVAGADQQAHRPDHRDAARAASPGRRAPPAGRTRASAAKMARPAIGANTAICTNIWSPNASCASGSPAMCRSSPASSGDSSSSRSSSSLTAQRIGLVVERHEERERVAVGGEHVAGEQRVGGDLFGHRLGCRVGLPDRPGDRGPHRDHRLLGDPVDRLIASWNSTAASSVRLRRRRCRRRTPRRRSCRASRTSRGSRRSGPGPERRPTACSRDRCRPAL